jgi:hypothetical protein
VAKATIIHELGEGLVITRGEEARDVLGVQVAGTVVPLARMVNRDSTDTLIQLISDIGEKAGDARQAFLSDARRSEVS